MSFNQVAFLVILLIVTITSVFILANKENQKRNAEKFNALNPEEKNNILFGPINEVLICPHCQTKGNVHSVQKSRITQSTSKGKAGGILKVNTNSTVTMSVHVTQHHCDKCNSTWDI